MGGAHSAWSVVDEGQSGLAFSLTYTDINDGGRPITDSLALLEANDAAAVKEHTSRCSRAKNCMRCAANLSAAGHRTGPLFRQVCRGGHGTAAPLGAESIRAIIRARTAAIDGATGRIGGHSLRVGSARDLAASGASVAELQQAGGSSAGAGSAEAVQSRRVTPG